MIAQGICHKMRTRLGETVDTADATLAASVEYELVLAPFVVPANPLIGKIITLEWTGKIQCIGCGGKTTKSYSQGHCFKCFKTLASCDLCIMKPETCHFHLDTCRQPDWALTFCFSPHVVYLANSSGLKVGITRENQMPTRWLDQGARQALPIFSTTSRRMAGYIEAKLAEKIADKTDWRALLKSEASVLDLVALREALLKDFSTELNQLAHAFPEEFQSVVSHGVQEFAYPVMQYPTKVTSLGFDKTAVITGKVQGIKGQYLILDSGVLNLRKFTGYELKVSCDDPALTAASPESLSVPLNASSDVD